MSDTPTQIGPYAIERRLGAGGMAETFVATRRMQTIEQRVCLKRILPAYAQDPTARRLFHREANISARLRHANLVQVLDVGEENGTPYLVMELVEGVDLDHVASAQPGKRLPAELVGYLMGEIAHGLHEAHGGDGAHEGVVHRDLSPSNVLLSTQGEVKVADFGIAKALSSGDKATATMMRGKFAYMAPEQLDGAPLDPRADMYALGVIGFELLAGVRPFDAESDARLVLLISKNERRSIHELVPEAPAELRDTIEALLSHQKEKRPANGHEVVERLAPMLPAAVVARRQLAKLVSVAYEAKLAAAPSLPPPPVVDAALAATVMANVRTTPSGRPPAMPAAGTPMAVGIPETSRRPRAAASEPPGPMPARAGTSPALLFGGALAITLLLGVTAAGIYALGLGGAPSPPPTSVVGAPPPATTHVAARTTPPPATTDEHPPTTVGVASTPPTTEAPTTTARPPAPTRVAVRPPTTSEATPPASEAPPTSAAVEASDHAHPTPHDGEGSGADDGPTGNVHIVVSPWGLVWIDGRYVGRSPVNAELRAGSHRVGAGFVEPTTSRTIRVRAGSDERIELDVESE